MAANLNDDSNIEYKNIFPQILSRNKKISVNINIDRMADRSEILLPKHSPFYEPTYKLVDKRIVVPSIGSAR